MNFQEFAKTVKSDEISGAYLLHGTEEYIKDLAVKTVTEKYIADGLKDINFSKVDASGGDISNVEKAMIQLPLMSQKRVVTVFGLSLFSMSAAQLKQAGSKKAMEEIEQIINKCPQETIILFVARSQAASACVKIFSKYNKDVEFKHPIGTKKQQYIQRMAIQESLNISPMLQRMLIEYTGMELLELNLEIKKLKAYVQDEEVTENDIYTICSAAAEYSVFKMLKHITAGEGSKAIAEYRKLIMKGQSPQAVISMIERQFRALFYISELDRMDAMSLKSAANKLSTKDFVIRNMQRTARRLDRDKIKKIAKWCADADYLVKRGKISIDNSAELLIVKLINI